MSVVVVAPRTPVAMQSGPVRVMVVDDSVVIRGMIARWIEAEPDLTVAASMRTGRDALNNIERANPDVVVLDIEMPDLDGLSALPLLLAKKRDLIVIMASTLTRRNAEISFKALSLGAADYVPKPESTREAGAADAFRRDLLFKIRHLAAKLHRPIASPSIAPAPTARGTASELQPRPVVPVSTKPFGLVAPRALLIGSSTGGPQALMSLVAGIGAVIDRVPVLITQHMPPTFTTILAEHLERASGRPVREGVDGEMIQP